MNELLERVIVYPILGVYGIDKEKYWALFFSLLQPVRLVI